jgi:hypothetical protein
MEQVALRFQGGSLNGGTTTVLWPWPPPERIGVLEGDDMRVALIPLDALPADHGVPLTEVYVKTSQSNIDDETAATVPGILRGALYEVVQHVELGSVAHD